MLTKAPKGTRDILPGETAAWRKIEGVLHELATLYGYEEIRTPVFEHTELFQRSVGDTTDIVQKEMYTFPDKAGRSLTLRPEGTAGVVRSFIEQGMTSLAMPVRLYYLISAYRYENVQKGRYREFHQFGAEAFGAPGPDIDAEVISLLWLLFERLGIKQVQLNINSIGCPVCRRAYQERLKTFFVDSGKNLCQTCLGRLNRNPMRILDCKEAECRTASAHAPDLLDFVCGSCRDHFDGLQQGLVRLQIPYQIDKRIVRGLDYYTRTVFEFVSDSIGAQGTVCGGGRYDGLVEECGGARVPGIGFGLGLERLFLQMESEGVSLTDEEKPKVFLVAAEATAIPFIDGLAYALRRRGIRTDRELTGRSLKAQMKYAGKTGVRYVVVIGGDEIASGSATLKDMDTGETVPVSLDPEALKNVIAREM
ncbi:MAG TPA: histidine--tRNA ligase [Clostridiales bacterium]|nr:histidine--tRNA ligase [Clostridiales bacterium]